jgi:ssDNA-binding Zn-finger/Zn-ribbon topoisomerase 1
MSAYEALDKPSNLIEVEGRCPLCGTVMMKSKSVSYEGKFYSFAFPLYLCLSHYHGYFRWLGRKGHARIKFPEILKFGTVVDTDAKESIMDGGLINLKCPDCDFAWRELRIPHDKTWCPDCRKEIRISNEAVE